MKTGTWTLNIHKTLPYDMSGAHLRTLNNSNHNAITCKVFTDLPSVETIDLKKLEINAQSFKWMKVSPLCGQISGLIYCAFHRIYI